MTTYTIRHAAPEDIPAIHRMTVAGIHIWGADILDNLKPWMDRECTPEFILGKVLSPDYEFFVAESSDGVIVGTVNINTVTNHLYGMYCEVRGKGVGTALASRVVKVAEAYRMEDIKTEVIYGNWPASGLAEKYGAVLVGNKLDAGVNYVIRCPIMLSNTLLRHRIDSFQPNPIAIKL